MSNDDLDRTMIMPSPGRKRGTAAETAASPEPMQPLAPSTSPLGRAGQGQNEDGLSLKMVGSSGSNVLVNAATLIFSLARQLRNTTQHSDIPGLLAHVTGLMKSFEKNSIEKEVSPDVAYEARYILCAFIDEIVLNTPWGRGSVWSYSSLLSALHNDTSGGERFFQMLATKSDAPAQNVVILELMYHCLCMGFQGKFAVQDNGRAALEQIRTGLYRSLRELKGDADMELSPHWVGETDGRPMVARLIPWWVVASLLGGLLVMVYLGFFFALNEDSDGVYTDIGKLGREVPQMIKSREILQPLVDPAVSAVNIPQLNAKFAEYLSVEIARRQVSVTQEANGLKLTIHNKGLFGSGSAYLSGNHQEMFSKISAVLASLPGPFVVSGHSDSQKIRTIRFPSNWHLSDERARSIVSELVKSGIEKERLVAQGKADTEPVASNESADGRERNRRIEIFIRSY